MRKVIALLMVVALLALPTATLASSRTALFVTRLTGAAEAPGPGDPDGRGLAIVTINPAHGRVCAILIARDITLPATLAHIHVGPAGVPGPVVVNFVPPGRFGFSAFCTTGVDPVLAQAIIDSPWNYYVNVHNADFPPGALRGQLD